MAESGRYLVSRHNAGRKFGKHLSWFSVGEYRELEEAERLGSGISTGTPGYSRGSAREAPGGQSMSLSVQGSAGSRGSLLAPHAAKQVAALLTRSLSHPFPSLVWTQRLSCFICNT